jgi:hypothetical protein
MFQVPAAAIFFFLGLSLAADPCQFNDAINMGATPTMGDSYFMKYPALKRCLDATQMTNYQALWTLHNLRYGVAETYSFTEIVTNVRASDESNVCGYQLHDLSLDISKTLLDEIRVFNETMEPMPEEERKAFLAQSRPAYPFHEKLMRLFNSLHDAHTFYSSPFDTFRVYFPVGFGSRLTEDGKQQVTLRYSTNPTDPIGRIAYVYQQLFGGPPLPVRYAGQVVTHINDLEALVFLEWLVSSEGLFAGNFQQMEQRLNGFIFNVDLIVLAQVVNPAPDFEELKLTFEDGTSLSVKLIGQFSHLSTSAFHGHPSIVSSASLSAYLHTNKGFDSFMKFETDIEAKEKTLTLLGDGIRGRQAPELWERISKKHKALLDTVNNVQRDNLLNLPILEPVVSESAVVGESDVVEGRIIPAPIRPRAWAEADLLEGSIKEALAIPTFLKRMLGITEESVPVDWTVAAGMTYAFVGSNTVVVRIPSMSPEPRFPKDTDFYFFPAFVEIQKAAKERGIKRVLFDVSKNGGGFVMSAYALMWYTMKDLDQVCPIYRRRITNNWKRWLESFGSGVTGLVDRHLVPLEESLADDVDRIFNEVAAIINVLYDGLGLTIDDFGGVTRQSALARARNEKAKILRLGSKAEKTAAILDYLKGIMFVPEEAPVRKTLIPSEGFCPFDPTEFTQPGARGVPFESPMDLFLSTETKRWGTREAEYSAPAEFGFCHKVLAEMPEVAKEYERGYWEQIAFVSDGTCGSACALFTQGIQTNGDAVAFTYGGLADRPLDVATFAGGNVEEYDDFWPGLAFGARIGRLASKGEAAYTKAHEKSWVASPIAFPSKAKARFNWNMMFVKAMGEHALPRQFYLIPGRKHFNRWGNDEKSMNELYHEIASIADWGAIPAQFAATHGQCPKESTPFAH